MQEELSLLAVGSTLRDPGGERYVIEALLGTGGFGAVYLVRAQSTRQHVFALKEEINPDRYRRASFAFEAEILRRLRHPALPRVYQVFEDAQHQRVYMLMEHIAGQNLEALRREQPERRFPLPLVLILMAPIVDALSYLHRQDPPIVHLDIKPSNIIVPPQGDRTMLVDFGIAKEYVENRTTTVVRHVTHGFAAPEQYGGGTTPRTDLYGLGATFYTLLTGKIPPDSVLRAAGSEALQPARLIVPDIPEEIDNALGRALALQSKDRFETVEQFWQELRPHAPPQQEHLPRFFSPATTPTLPEPTREQMPLLAAPKKARARPSRRQWAMLLLALILVLTVASGAAFLAFALTHHHPPVALHQATPSVVTSTAPCAATSIATPVSTAPSGSAGYPSLASCYGGTIYDELAHEQTPMYLMNVQENQGSIHGTFQGLGLVGPFQGTITPDGALHFTVTVHAGAEALVFDGTIKIGGDIVGNFRVLDQRGNFTGEYGPWNVGATA